MRQKLKKELKKRDVRLVDQSLTEVNLTLWGKQAETSDELFDAIVKEVKKWIHFLE